MTHFNFDLFDFRTKWERIFREDAHVHVGVYV